MASHSRRIFRLMTYSVFLAACQVLAILHDCPCEDANNCRPIKTTKNTDVEVVAFSNGRTDIGKWRWETITTFVAPSTFSMQNTSEANTMCVTHRQGKKFGITVKVNLTGPLNASEPDAENWVKGVIDEHSKWSSDVINIDLMPYFRSDHDSVTTDHVELVNIILNLHDELKKMHQKTGASIEISCVIPWKPPCASQEATCFFTQHVADACDYFILNPESFLDVEDEKCRASATIPFTKLVYGISEYNAHHLPSNLIVLGVTWHGYDYTCSDLTNDVCTVGTVKVENSTVTRCDFSKKKVAMLTDIAEDHPTEWDKAEKSGLHNAPFLNYKEESVNHQVWFEDHSSLIGKYSLVKELSLKGVALLYADDLSRARTAKGGLMWSWVAHEFMLAKTQAGTQNNLHCADTVAGVAVGCLVLGLLLGVAFTCITFHKRIRKPKQPFMADAATDEYTDEDPNL